jgi:DNA/RNA-binding domain of Phe-tRNA-synthetase-like protein
VNFTIDEKTFAYFPAMKLAVVIVRDVNNQFNRPEVWTELKQSWISAGKAAAEYGNPQSHLRIKPWVEHFKALGVSRKEFPSSIEALVRRAGKGGEPMSINPLVDFYNSVSLKYLVPAGGFDLDQLDNGLELRFSRTGDEFQALDDPTVSPVPEGEISYADGSRILTRHFIWRQSKIGLILPTSKNVLLVSEIPGELEGSICEDVLAALAEGIQKHFQIAPSSYIMSANKLVVTI